MVRETLHGVIQGDSIHLNQPSSLPAGTQVEVVVTLSSQGPSATRTLAELFGAWKEDGDQLDEHVEWCRQQRKVERRGADL